MAKNIMVEEIEGEDVVLDGEPRTRRVVQRVESPPPKPIQPKALMPKDWARIILEENENIPPIGLFIGLNGASWILRPGFEVGVPPGIIEILNNAVMSVPVKDPQTLQVIDWRDKLRYPYRLMRQQQAA